MVKGVFTHSSESRYNDQPELRYHFPQRYLKAANACVDDWIVYYSPKRNLGRGTLGYEAIAKLSDISKDVEDPDMFYANIAPGSFLPFESFVPYKDERVGYLESGLNKEDGSVNKGKMGWSIRSVSDLDFFRIVARGFPEEAAILPRADNVDSGRFPTVGFKEEQAPFVFETERTRIEQTITRPVRDRVFRSRVLDAYDSRCALSGFKFINGGGRAEAEAAHIKPVQDNGPDAVQNGIALSGTVHWMFDRGLIGLRDNLEILVSRQVNNPNEIWQLFNEDKKARAPADPSLRPHPSYLAWHRENCFKH
ncbi:MAG: restriction endonuclease [Hirschia sp.]|nr:restriction endonuclease [Hirschia sp.]MBF18581.1 restriction endonuclease [Hirschia sp.]|tara:strand:- start:620 stop:1543 length:924 start_codon:yes stop_codon:yes gene_type:complete